MQVTTSSLEASEPSVPNKPLKRLEFGLVHHGDIRTLAFSVVNASIQPALLHAACGLPQDFNDADRSAKDLSGFVQVEANNFHSVFQPKDVALPKDQTRPQMAVG